MSKARDRRRRWDRRNADPDATWPSPPPGYQRWLDHLAVRRLVHGDRELRDIAHLFPRKD